MPKITGKSTGSKGTFTPTPKAGGGMVTMGGKTYWASAAQLRKFFKIG